MGVKAKEKGGRSSPLQQYVWPENLYALDVNTSCLFGAHMLQGKSTWNLFSPPHCLISEQVWEIRTCNRLQSFVTYINCQADMHEGRLHSWLDVHFALRHRYSAIVMIG